MQMFNICVQHTVHMVQHIVHLNTADSILAHRWLSLQVTISIFEHEVEFILVSQPWEEETHI